MLAAGRLDDATLQLIAERGKALSSPQRLAALLLTLVASSSESAILR